MRKNHKKMAIVIVALVALSMIAPSFVLLFSNSNNSNAVYSNSTANSNGTNATALQNQIDSLSQALNSNPQDTATRLSLANTYYDLAVATQGGNSPADAGPIFKQAVAEYQEVAKTQKDVNILVDMATAAFYGGEDEVADKTFKEALALKPDFLNALTNYGFFLMEAKNDYMGAIAQWNTALAKSNPSQEDTGRLNGFIKMAQERLQSSFEQSGSINNPGTSSPSGAK